MDWSNFTNPAMRLETRFGHSVVPVFCDRPRSIWAMVEEAVAKNGDGEALICGNTRMTWREVARNRRRSQAGCGRGV
jgi:hypothetical protein